MSGLSRFDFYPRDWFLDTRELSDRAKGCYIDLLAGIYNHGGPLPYEEKYLARLCGYGNIRSLRFVLKELLEIGKIRVAEGEDGSVLVNGRAMEEISKANAHINRGKMGGRPKSPQNEAETNPKPSRNQAENDEGFVENQGIDQNPPSPSSSPSKKETDQDFEDWWQLVPMKKAKGQARKAFRKALKRGTLDSLREGMKQYAAEMAGHDPRFIKHPSTWLNGECWLDDSAPRHASNGNGWSSGQEQLHPDAERMLHTARVEGFRKTGKWDATWGPRPDNPHGAAA